MKVHVKRGMRTTEEMGCPTPGKRGFATEEDLKTKLCKDPKKSGMSTYSCACGLWHLATRKKKK